MKQIRGFYYSERRRRVEEERISISEWEIDAKLAKYVGFYLEHAWLHTWMWKLIIIIKIVGEIIFCAGKIVE